MIWKTVHSHPSYEASEDGRIRMRPYTRMQKGRGGTLRSIPYGGKMLSGTAHPITGYLRVSVRNDSGSEPRQKTAHVHRMVCEAFHGPAPPNKPWALHRNDNKIDNRPDNLYWGDKFENCADAVANGKKPVGESHPMTHITDGQAAWIRENYMAKTATRGANAMAKMFGVHRTTIENIVSGRTFRYLAK